MPHVFIYSLFKTVVVVVVLITSVPAAFLPHSFSQDALGGIYSCVASILSKVIQESFTGPRSPGMRTGTLSLPEPSLTLWLPHVTCFFQPLKLLIEISQG